MTEIEKERLISAMKKKIGKGGNKITQKALADILGIRQGTISKILNGNFSSKTKAVEKICLQVGIDPTTDQPLKLTESQTLISAIARNWDGSEAHAFLLAALIDSVGKISRQYLAHQTK